MIRVAPLLVVMVLAGVVHAEPTLVILQIEAKDAGTDAMAETLTSALRTRAKKGRFRLSAATPKAITAATLKGDCKATERACAAKIGADLAVDFVLSGEIGKRGKHHILVLSLFDVRTKQRARSLTETVGSSIDVKQWARSIYQRVVDVEIGDLIIVANAQSAEVFVDGEAAAILVRGRATIPRLAIGVHQIVIRAKGYRPIDVEVTVDGSTTQSFLLEPETSP